MEEHAAPVNTENVLVSKKLKNMVPIATVEKDGFKTLLKTTDPRYELPNRKYFASEILPQKYSEVRGKLSERLAKVAHFAPGPEWPSGEPGEFSTLYSALLRS
ncbi:hypothetical protein QQF64_031471 [Cirrhinus molitorella]|uniref:Uncharacterized protein n=1 Tax=Cirrhinus molitorella TaxID=172907 RepID=A0ABR3MX37_9TELE